MKRRIDRIRRNSSLRRLQLETLEDRRLLTAVAAPSNLVSWWSAENSGADVMGLNNASLYNGATYAAGKVGQAFSFDGVDDRAAVADSDSLKFTNSMSIEGWILVRGFSTTNHGFVLFRGDDRGGLDPYTLSIETNGNLTFGVCPATNAGVSIGAPVPLGQLIHVAATLDDATGAMKLYENGVVVAQQVTAIRPFGDLDPRLHPGVGIGTANSTYNAGFDGLIDELSVYDRALTPSEVQGIYKAGRDGKVFSPVAVDGPSVIEGPAGTTTAVTFAIQRTGNLSGVLTVNWATADDTATAGADYVAASGSITFQDGESTKAVQVAVTGDSSIEPSETFKLVLTPAGGTPVMGLATIITDDVSISIGNASALEGSSGLKVLDRFVSDGSGGLSRSRGLTFGPDGNHDGTPDLYVASADNNSILRYDGLTGSFIDTFVASGSGGLSGPVDLAFGPDGKMYVSSYTSGQLLRYDGSTGAFLDVVASGLSPEGITFGADGSLFIANSGSNDVLRYANSELTVFVTAGSGTLNKPRKAVFGPDVNGDHVPDLFVTSEGTGAILRYDGATGSFLGTLATPGSGKGIIWEEMGTDGYLYVSAPTAPSGDVTDKSILRYNAVTGALVDSLDLGRDGWAFHIGPGNIIYNTGASAGGIVDRIGPRSVAAFDVSLSSASPVPTAVAYSTAAGTAQANSDYVPASGTLTFAPGEITKSILVSTVDNAAIELAENFAVNLSNATGGTIGNGQGTGTILDNDTKFYVVNDTSADQTFEYGSNGASGESYNLNTGDTAPRGVASTASGTTVWVVDANRKVYVYSNSGVLQGSWTAGSLNSAAQVEGIATNGTDVWLLDNQSDKVYLYAGAASRLSGSQNAASSFSLVSGKNGNTNGKGIVTDGASLWVVDDGDSSDKVFKYSVSGTAKGSWTIDAADAHPTGLTIDPANVSDIWIVDSGTDKVYQYTAAAGRTSGSQSAAATFTLASGNTNPQDIADPPVGAESMSVNAILPSASGAPVAWEPGAFADRAAMASGSRFEEKGFSPSEHHELALFSLLNPGPPSLSSWPELAEKSSAQLSRIKNGENQAGSSASDDHDLALRLIADELATLSTAVWRL